MTTHILVIVHLRLLVTRDALQLVCLKHTALCAQVLEAPPGEVTSALAVICQSFIKATLQSALKTAQQRICSAAIGLDFSPVSAVIVQLLQAANALLHQLHGAAAVDQSAAALSANFCYETVVALLSISKVVSENATLLVRAASWRCCSALITVHAPAWRAKCALNKTPLAVSGQACKSYIDNRVRVAGLAGRRVVRGAHLLVDTFWRCSCAGSTCDACGSAAAKRTSQSKRRQWHSPQQ